MSTKVGVCLVVAFAAVLTSVATMIQGVPALAPAPHADLSAVQDPIARIRIAAWKHGVDPDVLLAVAAQESSLGIFLEGDSGCSLGWFHINACVNDIAPGVIGDVGREAEWAAARIASYGYAESSTLAIARYNSPARPNYGYAALVQERLQELPLFLARYETQGNP